MTRQKLPKFLAILGGCLLGGGILYTLGAGLYAVGKKIPYIHSVFHLFVLGGSVLHTISVWGILQ